MTNLFNCWLKDQAQFSLRSGVYIIMRGSLHNVRYEAYQVLVNDNKSLVMAKIVTSGKSTWSVAERLRRAGYEDYLTPGCWLTWAQRKDLADELNEKPQSWWRKLVAKWSLGK